MKKSISALALAGTLLLSQTAMAAGCIKGAVAGGVAGHLAHHHAVAGAVAGCFVGHHMAKNQPSAQLLKNGRKHSRPISNHAFTAPGSRELFLLPVLRVPLHLCGKLLAGIRITCVIFCPSL
ncbi:hypothetical protein [Tatumella ptyseos]|uniref:Glycine zipper 2TM domain n=1 Tax=Tatumella ptyseos TaxID=82987 RepID=A0A2X5NNE2_9GAMM|nr:hypothetical protein [Tatumella ptyseos]SQK74656.1 Glycine zipper 2TM domain [Tatumella ptyseos]